MNYEILLYYKYAPIKKPEDFAMEHKEVCTKLGLKGRVIISKEGINGTLEGLVSDTKKYRRFLESKKGFKNMHWKLSKGTGSAFSKLSIKVRDEIVSLSLPKRLDVDPRKTTGIHLAPKDLKKWLDKGERFTIIDMRNKYEHKVGAFEGSVLPPMNNFRDLPKVLPMLKEFKNEKVLTVCTGGVRCEKASGYLVKKGFKDVYQLDGGIVSFMEKYPGEHFKGALYVFDGRMTMAFDPKTGKREIIGSCEFCGDKTERYSDCTNQACKSQMLCCESCAQKDKAYCSAVCFKAVKGAIAKSRVYTKAA